MTTDSASHRDAQGDESASAGQDWENEAPDSERPAQGASLPTAQLQQIIEQLERIADNRSQLAALDKADYDRLLSAAGRIAHPGRAARRQIARQVKKRRLAERGSEKPTDDQLLDQTGIRSRAALRRTIPCPTAPFEPTFPPTRVERDEHVGPELSEPRNCYICKRDYKSLHFFYDSLCPDCGRLNWQKRWQTADLRGRVVLVTGARVKIGYQAALKLLRAGAHVVATTRFPADAAARYQLEEDCGDWYERLQIHGLDLRHVPSVEKLAHHLCERLPRLDFLLNNACQTVRRPPGFYAHLIAQERELHGDLSEGSRSMLAEHISLRQQLGKSDGATWVTEDTVAEDTVAEDTALPQQQLPLEVLDSFVGIQRAAELSQLALTPDDELATVELFPTGQYDQDLQQIDLRKMNSWRLRLAEVPTVELLEVHLVNAVAPFLLNARLKPLMLRTPNRDKHIVNVSAMEGVFYRAFKTDKHPHTNMAKASLNMLTRTSAQDYVADGIHMNSVDTGWITDEDPVELADRKEKELGFRPPLDVVDAAARICDPFFHGLLTGEHRWGKFWKDYQIANW